MEAAILISMPVSMAGWNLAFHYLKNASEHKTTLKLAISNGLALFSW